MKTTISCIIAFMMMTLASCANSKQGEADTTASSDKVEVMYFHGKNRCATCKAVGEYSRELVNELNDSTIIWQEVDLSTPNGEEIGDRYEIIGSGLVIAKGAKHEDVTEMAFRYALNDSSKFKSDLKALILDMKQ